MSLNIKEYYKTKKKELMRSQISNIRLKDLILKSNKSEVIDFALRYLEENCKYEELECII